MNGQNGLQKSFEKWKKNFLVRSTDWKLFIKSTRLCCLLSPLELKKYMKSLLEILQNWWWYKKLQENNLQRQYRVDKNNNDFIWEIHAWWKQNCLMHLYTCIRNSMQWENTRAHINVWNEYVYRWFNFHLVIYRCFSTILI